MSDDERHGDVHFGNGDFLLHRQRRKFLHDDVVDFHLNGVEAEACAAGMDAGTVQKDDACAFSVDERAGDVAANFKAVCPRGGGGLAVWLVGGRINAPVEIAFCVQNAVGDFRCAVETDGHLSEDCFVIKMAKEKSSPAGLIGGAAKCDIGLNGHVLSEGFLWQKQLRNAAYDGMDEFSVFDFPFSAVELREAVQRCRLVEILLIDDFAVHGRGHIERLCGQSDGEAEEK